MEIDHSEIAKRLLLDEEYFVDMSDLVGEFDLSGVDTDSTSIKDAWGEGMEDCQVLSFILNDIVFTAIENPEDGYRSSMRDIVVEKFEVHNQFQPIKVYTKLRENSREEWGDSLEGETCSILDMYDKENDKLILSVGTGNTNDYYPYFVASWNPENMAVNNG